MGQLPKFRADTVCHVNTFTDTSGISLQHWRLHLGFQQDFGWIRFRSRAHETKTRRKITGIIIRSMDLD